MNNFKREIIITKDGSQSIFLPEQNESYHSKHGAIQETYHVFIKNGLDFFLHKNEVSILEIGFGTGLNALITLLESEKRNQKIHYTTLEAFPLTSEIYEKFNFHELLNIKNRANLFLTLHRCEGQKKIEIVPSFLFEKLLIKVENFSLENQFDLVYFDAFGFDLQPELWSVNILKKMFLALKNKGILTTYACRSVIVRNLEESGFQVKKVSGAIGKREMTIALKNE